ncbi:MAG: histidinol-phosphate transaminase [Pseudomonadota bacterium]
MSRFERPNIQAMQGYSFGEQPDDSRTIKLNTNENPYPPSPAVQQALQGVDISRLRIYPQATADPLRNLLAELHGLTPDHIVVTNGGDEALRLALTTFVAPGQVFGMAEPSYSLYPVLAEIQDASICRVALKENWNYPDTFCQQLNNAGAQLTCVVNPHAPSGTLLPASALADMAAQLNGLLLIDEAYADFVDPELEYDCSSLLQAHDNVLILRTFSKGYSLAGLRLGYLLGHPDLILPILNKTRDSYNVDLISQTLGQAAVNDLAYAQNTWAQVREHRQLLQNNLAQLGLPSPDTQSNFILATVPPALPVTAEEIYLQLKANGILVRYFSMPGLQDKLRITVGKPEENQALLENLAAILNRD